MIYFNLFLTAVTQSFCSYKLFETFYDRRDFFMKSKFLRFCTGAFFSLLLFLSSLPGSVFLNLASSITFCFLIGLTVFKVRFPGIILYTVVADAILIMSEVLTGTILIWEEKWLSSVSMFKIASYEQTLSSPLIPAVQFIFSFIPILIIKKIFDRNKVFINNGLFALYLAIPILYVGSLLILPTLGLDITTSKVNRYLFMTYIVLSLIAICLILHAYQRHSELSQMSNKLLEEKLNATHENDLLAVSSKALKTRLSVVEEAMENERILRHDRRHFENMIYSLLQNDDSDSINKAKQLLEEKINSEPQRLRKWCENETVNATIEFYVSMAEKQGIPVKASLSIPKEIRVDSLKLSIALGNLLENAIHANELLEPEKRFLNIKSLCKRQLLIQIDNACLPSVKLNEKGLPYTNQAGHGTGTKSIQAFSANTCSEVLYSVENGVFTVRMII